ncbi:hypothetical protein BDB00DRAFT_875051 [Zychaea mexicana]|uniref:uncharacterized protein n=1 Tax=Zychaea mexicana TaxID=64656 RepID=UPI0022FF1DFD|nr:uncharacterized protein BDB00DRAFT_875051 [Zychaea mexicana]KAI9490719.1 hypothetical protein BDB00DRAFT_875051 [Zychaea mexicana]
MTKDAPFSILDSKQRDSDEQASSVQAWLHLHLDNYVELALLDKVPELKDGDSWIGDGTPLLCLAHRFCPTAIPDLLFTLRDESNNTSTPTDKISLAARIFESELHVSIPTNAEQLIHNKDSAIAYMSSLKQTIDEQLPSTEQTLRMTQLSMVSERQYIQVTRRTRESTVEDDEFERRATHVLNKISQLRNQLNDMTLVTTMSTTSSSSAVAGSRPSGAANTTAITAIANDDIGRDKKLGSSINLMDDADSSNSNNVDLTATVQQFESALQAFKEGELAEIHAYIRDMSEDARTSVYARIQAIDAAHAALEAQLQDDFRAIRMGVRFAQLTTPIRNELEFIQAKMLKTTTTEEGIRELEDRTRRAGSMINDMEAKYSSMLIGAIAGVGRDENGGDEGHQELDPGQQRSYRVHFDALKQKHRLVSSWVDEVRVWFIEAERIRRWIEERIKAIDSEPVKDALQSEDLTEYTLAMVDALNAKHEKMEKEVEKLNKEDMTRLRAHVKTLTGSDKQGDKDLSPADTTTIEITFSTLMSLDKLMHLLRRRSYDLQMLTLRLFWELEHKKASAWVTATDSEVDELLQRARWQQDEEKASDRAEAEAMKNMTVHMLLDIEQRASEFDQGQFTTTVNMYQEMDDSSKVELPPHLESRQVDVEEAFEAVTKRLNYVRQVVEQRLTVVDLVYRADELMMSGEQLREEITIAEQQATDADSDRDFTEQIRTFQEQAVQLVTTVAARIRYPEIPYPPSDMIENDKVNDTVRAAISARKSSLILLGEALDHKLQSYRRVLQLQKSASQLSDDIHQLEETVEKQIKILEDAKVDVFVAKCPVGDDEFKLLDKEREEQLSKAGNLKNSDWKILKDYLDSLKHDVDLAGAVAIQTGVLYGSMERLYRRIEELEGMLAAHIKGLEALKKRMTWEEEHEKVTRIITSTIQTVWEIIWQMQWKPNVDDLLAEDVLKQKMNTLKLKVDDSQTSQHVESAQKSYEAMINDLSSLLDDSQQSENLPSLFKQRQDALQQSVQDLQDSVEFAHCVHEQHAALIQFMNKAVSIHATGQGIADTLENAIKNVMEGEPQQFDDPIQQFDQSLKDWWTQYGACIPYPTSSANARASHPSSSTDDHTVNNDIKTVVETQRSALEELGQKLHDLADKFDTASKLKQQIAELYTTAKQQQEQAEGILSSIAGHRQDLSTDIMDIDALPDMNGLKAANQGFREQVEKSAAALNGLRDRCTKIDQTIYSSKCHPEVSITMASGAVESLASLIDTLDKVAGRHSEELDVTSERIDWEKQSQNAIKRAEVLQDELRQLVDRKNTITPGNVDQQEELADLKAQAESIQQSVSQLSNETLLPSQESYDRVISTYASISVDVPQAVIVRQSAFKGLLSRLSDMSEQTKGELDYLIERSSWERAANAVTDSCTQQEQQIEDFIQHRARWSMDGSSPTASTGTDAWKDLSQLEQQVVNAAQQMAALIEQCQTLINQHMEAPDTLVRRKKALKTTVQRLQDHLAFAKQVLDQRDTFTAYLEQAQVLESSCDAIKDGIEQGVAGQDQVDAYTQRVNTFCLDDSSLPYPIRSYKNHDSRCRSLDENSNIVIAEAFDAHHARLKELPLVLASALRSKQLQTERQAAGDAYMTEAQTVEDWINAKLESLDKVLDLDDTGVSNSLQQRQKADKRRSAIATVDATFAAMQTYNTAYNSLKLQARKLDDNDHVHERQTQIDQLWQKLSSSTGVDTKEMLKEKLRQAEFKQSVDEFEDQRKKLQDRLDAVDLSVLSDDQMAEWREQAQELKSQYLEKLGTFHRDGDEKAQFEQVASDHQNLTASLQDLDKRLHKHRLATDYDKRTDALTEFMHQLTSELEAMRDKYGYTDGINTEEDGAKAEIFTKAYDDAHQRLQEQLEKVEVQRSFFRSLQIQDAVTDDIRARQSIFENDYHLLETAMEDAKSSMEHFFQWRDLHVKLQTIQGSVANIDDDHIEQANDALAALESELAMAQTMADKLVASSDGQQQQQQQQINKSKFMQKHDAVAAIVISAKKALDIKAQEARERESLESCRAATDAIKERCGREIAAIKARIRSAGNRCADLFEDISSIEKHYRRASIGSASSQIGVYDDLTAKLNSVEAKAGSDGEKLLVAETRDSLRSLSNAITSEQRWNDMVRRALGHAKTAENITSWVNNCKNAIDNISENMDISSDKDMDAEMRDIQHRINDFTTIIESFKGMTQGIMQVNSSSGDGNDNELSAAVEALKNHVIQPCTERIDSEWNALQEQLSNLEVSMAKASKGVAVVRQMKTVLKLCSDTRGRLDLLERDPSRVTLSSAHKQQHRPLSGILREQDVLAIEQALNTIESEGQDHAQRELQKLDAMIADFGDADGAFVQQRSEMEAALDNMTTAMSNKRHDLAKALEVGKCLMITDDIDVLVDALGDAVEKAKTATAANKASTTNKADMQGKYIELDARYKYYERKITQSLEAARLATDDISDQKDRDMIVKHIGELKKRWDGVDQQAKTQRAELSKALAAGHVNRGRKSSLPTRKATNVLRERERSPSRLPAPPGGSHGNTSSPLLSATSRLLPSTSTSLPRPTARPTATHTTSTSRLTPPSVRRPPPSRSISNTKKPPAPPPNKYVADPKNDLDMEIGRIVNETPYRVKVKMVPGEVGRYWFGDANPKLAYCRVLKSKMVMVRVGGGWMELSQFLRGHALLEGDFIPKTAEPDQPVLPVQEGFIETRRRQPHIRSRSRSPSSSSSSAKPTTTAATTTTSIVSNNNNSSNNNNNYNSSTSSNSSSSKNLLPLPPSKSISSSRSTPQKTQTGYIDGDRYIAVDRYGNQLEVKMTKMTESTSGSARMKSRQ